MPGHVPDRCRRCGRPFTPSRPHRTRGLHNGCWTSAWHAGETHLYPRTRNLIDTATIALRLNVTTADDTTTTPSYARNASPVMVWRPWC